MRVQSNKAQRVFSHKRPKIIHIDIVDGSGSMEGEKYNAATKGVEDNMRVLKMDVVADYTQTIMEFASQTYSRFHYHVKNVPLGDVGKIKWDRANGMTPLYECVAKVVNDTIATKGNDEVVLLNIFTDGGENDSTGGWGKHEGGAQKLKELLEMAKTKHNFTVTFIGTSADILDIVQNIGISINNTFAHQNTAQSINTSYLMRSAATMTYSKGVASGQNVSEDFFTSNNTGVDPLAVPPTQTNLNNGLNAKKPNKLKTEKV